MLRLSLCALLVLSLGCHTAGNPELGTEPAAPVATQPADTVQPATAPATEDPAPAAATPAVHAGQHPISLQWISWDKKGTADVTPAGDGWYTIHGSQLNADREYLNIDGKIRRLSERELEFDGTVETRTRYNNGGGPCVKTGRQRFFAKGSRAYFRLQNMENCGGGRVVDYVDIYPGTSSL